MRLHPSAVSLLLSLLAVLGAVLPVHAQAPESTVAAAPCPSPTPTLVKDIWPGSPSSRPSQLVNVNGTLYFAAADGSGDVGLWKSDGTPAGTVVVKRFQPGAPATELKNFVAVGSRLFFTVYREPSTTELWKSDGTDASTQQLVEFDNQSLNNSEFVALGNLLFFRASTTSSGFELWKSDGTPAPAGTKMVQEIAPGSQDSYPIGLTVLNGELFFSANDGSKGEELWKSNGAGTSATLVKDLSFGSAPSSPDFLRVMGGSLYFAANDGSGNGVGLWKSSGAVGDAQLVASGIFMPGHVGPMDLTVAGNTLFFWLDDTVHGVELWASDGTAQGTRLAKDINPGGFDSNPSRLTAVGGTLFFLASNGVSGDELWRSDGTAQGTFLVRDIVPGSASTAVDSLVAGPGLLLAVLNDASSGFELWKSDGLGATRLTDITPPGSNAAPPASLTMVGERLFFAAADATAGRELFVIPLGELDCTRPTITCPADRRLEATSPQGIFFSAPPPTVSDDALAGLEVSVNAPTQGTFGLGTTTLVFTARDAAGNTSPCSFNVTVEDTTPPRLLCPQGEVVLEATMPTGALARYFVGVSDAVVPAPTMTYDVQPGSPVAIGPPRTVSVRASDGRQESTCSFTLTVRDTMAPRLTCPQDIVRVATSPEPVAVTYEYLLQEAAPATPAVSTEHPSGSLFPVGVTPVTLTARDTSGHETQCTFSVANLDPAPPEITCPGPQEVVATRPEGAAVSFPEAMARDNVGSPAVSYSPERGSTFPVGQTTVTATASDLASNTSSCTFTVTVVEGSGEGPSLPEEGCGCGAGSWSGGLGWLLLALMPLWARRRAGRVAR